jgi:hypothetical protein
MSEFWFKDVSRFLEDSHENMVLNDASCGRNLFACAHERGIYVSNLDCGLCQSLPSHSGILEEPYYSHWPHFGGPVVYPGAVAYHPADPASWG